MRALDALLAQASVANQLTLLRLLAVPVVALALLRGAAGVALAVFAGAVATDFLDGLAARRLGQRTRLGAFLDPAADKLLMLVTYVLLALPDRPAPFPEFALAARVPGWLTVLVVSRDVLIVVVSLAIHLAWQVRDFPPSRLGKWASAITMANAAWFLLANVVPAIPAWTLDVGVALTAGMLIVSGLSYLVGVSRLIETRPGEGSS